VGTEVFDSWVFILHMISRVIGLVSNLSTQEVTVSVDIDAAGLRKRLMIFL
jgi:hypothetical protein